MHSAMVDRAACGAMALRATDCICRKSSKPSRVLRSNRDTVRSRSSCDARVSVCNRKRKVLCGVSVIAQVGYFWLEGAGYSQMHTATMYYDIPMGFSWRPRPVSTWDVRPVSSLVLSRRPRELNRQTSLVWQKAAATACGKPFSPSRVLSGMAAPPSAKFRPGSELSLCSDRAKGVPNLSPSAISRRAGGRMRTAGSAAISRPPLTNPSRDISFRNARPGSRPSPRILESDRRGLSRPTPSAWIASQDIERAQTLPKLRPVSCR